MKGIEKDILWHFPNVNLDLIFMIYRNVIKVDGKWANFCKTLLTPFSNIHPFLWKLHPLNNFCADFDLYIFKTRVICGKRTIESEPFWYLNSQFTSRMTALLFGGVRFVLLATHTKRAFRCCRPMFGYDRWFTVMPSFLVSNDSSITVFSKYHVTFGRGRPMDK